MAASRRRSADPVELLLAEIWAVRYALLSFVPCGRSSDGRRQAIAPGIGPQDSRPCRRRRSSNRPAGCSPISLGQRSRERRRRRAMNRRRILLIVARLLAFAAIAQAVTIWICSAGFGRQLNAITCPHTSGVRCRSSAHRAVEVRLIWKIGRHRKPELASDDDAVRSDDGTGMVLSQSARDAGWKGLIEGPPQQVPADATQPGFGQLGI